MENRQEIQRIKEKYSKGTRIELIRMNDMQAVLPHTLGTVDYVDDIGTIHMKWDNGSSLGIIEGEDEFVIVDELKQEALERLKILKVDEHIIKFFENNNTLYVTDPTGRASQLTDREKAIVKKYEDRWNILVYYLIHTSKGLEEEYHLLFVAKNKDDWNAEKEDLKQGNVLTQKLVLDFVTEDETNYLKVYSKRGAVAIW